jgi:PAS domain S-box-containing protein
MLSVNIGVYLLYRFGLPGANTMTDRSFWKIVLIDDEDDIREVTTLALEDSGFQVATAENGTTGIQTCAQFQPQIVITDVRMPGMDGIQVLETVKQRWPDTEVIVATAFGEMELAIRALQLDASDFITKPINNTALHLALKRAQQRYLSRKRLADYTALLEKEHAETSQQLLKTFAYQKNLIESALDGILACDAQDKVVTFNRSMEDMLGYDRGQVLHRKTLDALFAAGEFDRLKQALAEEHSGGRNRLSLHETTLLDCNGNRVPVQVAAALLLNPAVSGGLVCFFRDLREIRHLEREMSDQARILHQDKMMSLGRLAASVVHEINNPLSGILNYIRLMIRTLERGPLVEERQAKFQQYLDLVESETDRCSQIISSLLTFSRKSSPQYGRIDIKDLIGRCALLSQHKLELSNIKLVPSLQGDIPPVTGDFNQLQQCIINLVFNAIDAMPSGGTLFLEAAYEATVEQVQIRVRDTGTGISIEDQAHIFEPFFTTKKEGYGVGLGLSTVYGIIERHKGSVSVESQGGLGATFIIHLPVLKE